MYESLEDLAETHALQERASGYYRQRKDFRRRVNWTENRYWHAVNAEASRLFTGYGIRPWRVTGTSFGVIVVAALFSPFVGVIRTGSEVYSLGPGLGASLNHTVTVFLQSLYFSTVTFTTLGYGNIRPMSNVGQYIAATEAMIGSLLVALVVGVFTESTWLR